MRDIFLLSSALVVMAEDAALTRFANSQIHQNVAELMPANNFYIAMYDEALGVLEACVLEVAGEGAAASSGRPRTAPPRRCTGWPGRRSSRLRRRRQRSRADPARRTPGRCCCRSRGETPAQAAAAWLASRAR